MPASRARDSWAAFWVLGAMIVAFLAVWVVWSPPGHNDLGAGEGYYAIQARNLLADSHQRLSPSLQPFGPPGFKPPLYPALLAASIAVLGPHELALRWPSLLSAAIIACALACMMMSVVGRWGGVGVAAMLLTLPWFADASRDAASAVVVAALGMVALALLAVPRVAVRRALVAGALLGLAFECKLWLALVPGLPALALVPDKDRRRALIALCAAAVAVASIHLLLVASFERDLLVPWLDFYFRQFLVERVHGRDMPVAAAQHPALYWFLFTDAWVLGLPLIALGWDWAVRRMHEPVPRAIVFWVLAGGVLSFFAVKQPIYFYPVMPVGAALAVLGARAWMRGEARFSWWSVVALAASAPSLAPRVGAPAPPLWAWAGAWLGTGAAWAATRWRPRLAPALAVGVASIVALGGLARETQRIPYHYRDPGYRVIAPFVAPLVAPNPPDQVSVLAPDAPAFEFHLMRRCRYWWFLEGATPEARLADLRGRPSIRVFVVDPDSVLYGGHTDPLILSWLESSTREVTHDIEARSGRTLGVRVFVRSDAWRAHGVDLPSDIDR